MHYTIQVRKGRNKVISVIEINQDLVPLIQAVTKDTSGRVDMMKHKDDLIYYLNGSDILGAAGIVLMLKKVDKAVLILNS